MTLRAGEGMRVPMNPIQLGTSSLAGRYEQVVYAALAAVWQRKQLFLQILAVTLSLGILSLFVMPQKYTAIAYVYKESAVRGFIGSAEPLRDQPVSVDASILVETQARLLRSQQLARQVVQRLGFERLKHELAQNPISSLIELLLYGDAVKSPSYKLDVAAAKLLRGLSVGTEPRAYLISARYTSTDPYLAADIANAFLTEYLRSSALQTASDRLAAARRELSKDLATLGEKHPTVVKMKLGVAAAEQDYAATMKKTSEQLENNAGETVAFAQPATVPSSPNPLAVIIVSLLVGVSLGIAGVLWTERRDRSRAQLAPMDQVARGKRAKDQTAAVKTA